MNTYIATFVAHIGAIRFKKYCDAKQIPARIMPVPRNLSSSCGTCVRFEASTTPPVSEYPVETEMVVEVLENTYKELFRAEDS